MRNRNWVFGKDAGLNFSGGVTPFSNRPINTLEGCASISDTNGNLILYTDGITVKDGSGTVRISGLQGNQNSTQAAVIVPDPGNPKRYYVFTTAGSTGGNKHVDGGLIDTTPAAWTWVPLSALMAMPATLGYSPTEKLVAIRHATQPEFWVLTIVQPGTPMTTDTGPGDLRVFRVTQTGVSWVGDQPLLQNVSDVGYMKASPGGKRIAIASFGLANLLVLPFSSSSGLISLPGLIKISCIPVPPPHNAMCPYGVEFSPSGELLYYTTIYPLGIVSSPTTDSLVYQFFLPSGPPVLIGAHPRTFSLTWNDGCALQFGSDGRIYIAQNLEQKLGVIAHPNLFGAACGLTFNALSLPPKSTCRIGLPNLIRDLF